MNDQGLGRREFIKGAVVGGAAAATATTPHLSESAKAEQTGAEPAAEGYTFFNLGEAVFIEALVDHMVPADELSPKGTDIAGGDVVRGQKLYEECIACHSLEPGLHGIGPSLHGVFNRKAGELPDYRYSPALKRSGIIWTADTLDAFIADSQQFLPANRMPYAGMPNAVDRADLIAYLQQAAK